MGDMEEEWMDMGVDVWTEVGIVGFWTKDAKNGEETRREAEWRRGGGGVGGCVPVREDVNESGIIIIMSMIITDLFIHFLFFLLIDY